MSGYDISLAASDALSEYLGSQFSVTDNSVNTNATGQATASSSNVWPIVAVIAAAGALLAFVIKIFKGGK